MKAHIWKALPIALAAFLSLTAQAADWETDFAKASTNAAKNNLFMLLDFSGSDWCGWCIKLDKEVFSQPEFQTYARKNLACILLDFPRQKKQSKKTKDQNAELSRKYGIQGFPTVIILSPNGDLVGQTGYQAGGPKAYVAHLESMIADYRKQHPDKVTAKPPAADAPPQPAAK